MRDDLDRYKITPAVLSVPWQELTAPQNSDELRIAERVLCLAAGELRPLIERAKLAPVSSAPDETGRERVRVAISATRFMTLGMGNLRGLDTRKRIAVLEDLGPRDAWKGGRDAT